MRWRDIQNRFNDVYRDIYTIISVSRRFPRRFVSSSLIEVHEDNGDLILFDASKVESQILFRV